MSSRESAMPRLLSFSLAVLLMPFAGLAVAQQQATEYRLGKGDEIKITVFGHDDLSGSFFVNEVAPAPNLR